MDKKDKTDKKAVALTYDMEHDRAPRVAAKGKGLVAEKIIEVAKENNIPLHQDSELAQVLEAMDLDTEIPPELFRAVAEVLAFIYKMNKKM
ncbi:MAG: flagellar biosynthesis protein FlhB [bacterium]|nr:flagellar biosynthesis protein FlhB [bacterium]